MGKNHGKSPSQRVRESLDHPVIDADGHSHEVTPVLLDYLRDIGGSDMPKRFLAEIDHEHMTRGIYSMTPQERQEAWVHHYPFWNVPVEAMDRATATLPRLRQERAEELGIDFSIIYPSITSYLVTGPRGGVQDEEVRRAGCRALNAYQADVFRDYADSMTAVAMVPMHTPEEAIDELEYAVNVLGLKAIVIPGDIRRPIPRVQREAPQLVDYARRQDTFGIDSEYDYDPFWAKCVELKVAATTHNTTLGFGTRQSPSNSQYNHIGHFAAAGEAIAKSLFFGGVTRRFPTLNFAFLEGGVNWACGLYADLISHWNKRNGKTIQELNPSLLDRGQLVELIARYGDERTVDKLEEIREGYERMTEGQPVPDVLNEFEACGVEEGEEFLDRFVRPFYFGCEGDDPTLAQAFSDKINPYGARLNAVFGSDIGHFDVTVMNEIVAESHELVDRGAMSEADFRDFMFTNPVNLHAGMNRDFFKGTVVEGAVEKLLEGDRATAGRSR